MRNIKKRVLAIFLATIIGVFNFQSLNFVFAAQKAVLSTGYIDLPSWITIGKVNIRSKPSTSASKLGTINNGAKVNILDGLTTDENKDNLREGWYKISYGSTFGYVFGDYVKLYEEKNHTGPAGSNPIKGIDVSHNQGKIDWQKVKNSGVKFAIIRGGYSTIEDKNFKTNIEGATAVGIKVGVYWFSHAYTSNMAKAEADKCISVISPYKNKLSYPVFFDYEDTAIKRGEQNKVIITMNSASSITHTFLDKMKANGYKTGLYTNKMYSRYYFTQGVRNSNNLWIAQYGNKCTYWGKYMMWQYSEKGKVDGISGNVDLNYYYGPNTNPTTTNISKTSISSIKNQSYTGNKITPNVTVKYGSKTLVKNRDYTLSYKNNTSIGTGSITITGKGNYNGTRSISFKIVPKTVSTPKLSTVTSSSIKLYWSKVTNATGYEVYRCTSKNGTYSKIKDITNNSTLSYINSSLSNNKTYYYKIRAYKTVNKVKYYGNYSTIVNTTTKMSTPSITLKSPKSKTILVSWKQVSGAKGYEVYRGSSKNGTYSKIIDTNKVNYTNTKLTKGKYYYYKVKAYKIVNKKKVYTSYSSIKSIKSK